MEMKGITEMYSQNGNGSERLNSVFNREEYARQHGWTLAELAEFEETYGVSAEILEAKRIRDDAEFRSLPPWERAPESHMG